MHEIRKIFSMNNVTLTTTSFILNQLISFIIMQTNNQTCRLSLSHAWFRFNTIGLTTPIEGASQTGAARPIWPSFWRHMYTNLPRSLTFRIPVDRQINSNFTNISACYTNDYYHPDAPVSKKSCSLEPRLKSGNPGLGFPSGNPNSGFPTFKNHNGAY